MSELSEFREGKDRYFGQDPDAPLTPEQQGRFSGLAYYPENSALQFALTIGELNDEEKETIEMATSTGYSQPYVRPALPVVTPPTPRRRPAFITSCPPRTKNLWKKSAPPA